MNQEIEELRAEKEALKLQLQEAKEAKDRRRLKAEMNTVIDDLERRLPLCVVCATNVPDRIFISCMHVYTFLKKQKKKVLKKQKKLRQMRDTKIHPEIHEPVQEPLGGSGLGGSLSNPLASTPKPQLNMSPKIHTPQPLNSL